MGDRSRAIPRPRPGHRPTRPRSTAARSRARPASCSTRSSACASGSGSSRAPRCACRFATGIASDRETAQALAQKYRDPSAASRTFALAFTHAQSGLRHLAISSDEALLFERLASRVLFADGSLRAGRRRLRSNELGQAGLWPHGISGDLPILLVRVIGDDDVALVRQVLQAQEYWRLKGLSADVVILNEDPSSYLDEMHAQLTALLDNGPVADVEAPIRRRVPPARRSDRQGRAHVARSGRAGGARRRPRRPRAQLDTPHPVRTIRPSGVRGRRRVGAGRLAVRSTRRSRRRR